MTSSRRPIRLIRRSGAWVLKRNVPVCYQPLEVRKQIWKVMASKTEAGAQKEAEAFWRTCLAEWQRVLQEQDVPWENRFRQAELVAKAHGFRYLPVKQVAALPLDELMERVEATVKSKDGVSSKPDPALAIAFLGLVSKTPLISALYAAYRRTEGPIFALHKSPSQIKRWRSADWKAVRSLIDHVGDVDITTLKPFDIIRLRNDVWATEKVPPLSAATLNARLYRMQRIFSTVARHQDFKLRFSFSELAMRQPPRRARPAFSQDWIINRILEPTALDRLQVPERFLMLGMINTGYRLMEGANLLPEEIVLDHQIPHLRFQGAFSSLKTPNAYRQIPLVGVSLEAFRAYPGGFPTLRDDPNLSARLNRFLTNAGLRETPQHTVHSLRHSFSSRLARAGVHENLIAELMGHSLRRGYGRGSPLELRLEAIQKISIEQSCILF